MSSDEAWVTFKKKDGHRHSKKSMFVPFEYNELRHVQYYSKAFDTRMLDNNKTYLTHSKDR